MPFFDLAHQAEMRARMARMRNTPRGCVLRLTDIERLALTEVFDIFSQNSLLDCTGVRLALRALSDDHRDKCCTRTAAGLMSAAGENPDGLLDEQAFIRVVAFGFYGEYDTDSVRYPDEAFLRSWQQHRADHSVVSLHERYLLTLENDEIEAVDRVSTNIAAQTDATIENADTDHRCLCVAALLDVFDLPRGPETICGGLLFDTTALMTQRMTMVIAAALFESTDAEERRGIIEAFNVQFQTIGVAELLRAGSVRPAFDAQCGEGEEDNGVSPAGMIQALREVGVAEGLVRRLIPAGGLDMDADSDNGGIPFWHFAVTAGTMLAFQSHAQVIDASGAVAESVAFEDAGGFADHAVVGLTQEGCRAALVTFGAKEDFIPMVEREIITAAKCGPNGAVTFGSFGTIVGRVKQLSATFRVGGIRSRPSSAATSSTVR